MSNELEINKVWSWHAPMAGQSRRSSENFNTFVPEWAKSFEFRIIEGGGDARASITFNFRQEVDFGHDTDIALISPQTNMRCRRGR